jgi:hypothetical protein
MNRIQVRVPHDHILSSEFKTSSELGTLVPSTKEAEPDCELLSVNLAPL